MQVTLILADLENFLERYSIDDGWSDWLRACGEKYATVKTAQERTDLLQMVRNCEAPLGNLDHYLPKLGSDQDCPPQTLRGLISLLDRAICRELEE